MTQRTSCGRQRSGMELQAGTPQWVQHRSLLRGSRSAGTPDPNVGKVQSRASGPGRIAVHPFGFSDGVAQAPLRPEPIVKPSARLSARKASGHAPNLASSAGSMTRSVPNPPCSFNGFSILATSPQDIGVVGVPGKEGSRSSGALDADSLCVRRANSAAEFQNAWGSLDSGGWVPRNCSTCCGARQGFGNRPAVSSHDHPPNRRLHRRNPAGRLQSRTLAEGTPKRQIVPLIEIRFPIGGLPNPFPVDIAGKSKASPGEAGQKGTAAGTRFSVERRCPD